MIEGEPLALYGIGALTLLILLRMVYRLASLTTRVAGYTLVTAAATGFVEPELLRLLLADLSLPFELLSYDESVKITVGWKYVEAWQAFGFHAVLGFLGVMLVYALMEWWYSAAAFGGIAWIVAVIELDEYLLESVLHWKPWMVFYEAVVYAGAAGFGMGVILAVVLLEPEFNSTVSGSQIKGDRETDENVFDRLNL